MTHPWTPEHTALLESMRGRPDAEIAAATGHPIWKIRERRRAAGIKGFSGRFRPSSRREWLLLSAAGLVVEDVPC